MHRGHKTHPDYCPLRSKHLNMWEQEPRPQSPSGPRWEPLQFGAGILRTIDLRGGGGCATHWVQSTAVGGQEPKAYTRKTEIMGLI